MRRRLLLSLLLATPALAGEPALLTADEAVPLLRAGGLSLYMRHAITDRSQADTGRLQDRAGQRNLSAAGEALARDLGGGLPPPGPSGFGGADQPGLPRPGYRPAGFRGGAHPSGAGRG